MAEKNELLEAALKLAEMHRNFTEKGEAYSLDAWNAAIAAIEKHRPKPEPLQGWVNVYGNEHPFYATEEDAKEGASGGCLRQAFVHEVTPAPEWERWDEDKVREAYWESDERNVFAAMAKAHNAEMRRVTGTEGK
jgi:hypothetical protein